MPNRFYGNTRALQTLTSAVQGGRLCHAYLIEGEDGTGKTAFAKQFAAAILCTGNGDRPCGECGACYRSARGIHPDLHLYADDSKNKVDTVRKIKESVYILPTDSDYKVYILCRAEEMTIEAQNALLKMLEEPPQDTFFLLTCRNRSALANTIVSRCVPLLLSAVSEDDCIAALTENGDTDPARAAELAAVFHGNIGRALDALTDESYAEERERKQAVLLAMISGSEYHLLKALSAYESKKLKEGAFSALLDCLIEVTRDTAAIKAGSLHSVSPFPQEAQALAEKLTAAQILRLQALFRETKGLLTFHVNLPLTLLTLGSKIKSMI